MICHVEHRTNMVTGEREKLVWDSGFVMVCRCHRLPCDGLDCGLFVKGQEPRRKMKAKPAAVMASIRARAWATRRAKYGERGHA